MYCLSGVRSEKKSLLALPTVLFPKYGRIQAVAPALYSTALGEETTEALQSYGRFKHTHTPLAPNRTYLVLGGNRPADLSSRMYAMILCSPSPGTCTYVEK